MIVYAYTLTTFTKFLKDKAAKNLFKTFSYFEICAMYVHIMMIYVHEVHKRHEVHNTYYRWIHISINQLSVQMLFSNSLLIGCVELVCI